MLELNGRRSRGRWVAYSPAEGETVTDSGQIKVWIQMLYLQSF